VPLRGTVPVCVLHVGVTEKPYEIPWIDYTLTPSGCKKNEIMMIIIIIYTPSHVVVSYDQELRARS